VSGAHTHRHTHTHTHTHTHQERDADSDQKNILADLKEELALLKEENKQLNHDSMSGKSLQEKAQAQDIEVRRLRFLFYYLFFINIKP